MLQGEDESMRQELKGKEIPLGKLSGGSGEARKTMVKRRRGRRNLLKQGGNARWRMYRLE